MLIFLARISRATGTAEMPGVPGRHVAKQGVTLQGRSKHSEAEQALYHGQRNLLYELDVDNAMLIRCLPLFTLAGTDYLPGRLVKTSCASRVMRARRCAYLRRQVPEL